MWALLVRISAVIENDHLWIFGMFERLLWAIKQTDIGLAEKLRNIKVHINKVSKAEKRAFEA